jgi:hypothetical protein
VTGIEFLALTGYDHATEGPTWEHHDIGYEKVSYPVMLDKDGVQYIYSADIYDVVLIDKKGRLVTKLPSFSDRDVAGLNKRIRELHAE